MLIVLAKSQSTLFDAPVRVAGSVRKDGTLVAPHMRIQKVAVKRPVPHEQPGLFGDVAAPAPVKRSRLDSFVAKHGGDAAVARTLATLTEGQQQRLLAEMGKLSGQTVAEVSKRFDGLAAGAVQPPESGETPDLFAAPAAGPDYLGQARGLYQEFQANDISGASLFVQAPFERRVRQFAESLPPGETEAREVLGRMFGGRYGNAPPQVKRFEGAAADQLQGEFRRKLRETGVEKDEVSGASKFAPGDIVEFKDRTGKMVSARVTEATGDGTILTVTTAVPPRSPFKVGITVRRTLDSVRLAHRPVVTPMPDPVATPAAPEAATQDAAVMPPRAPFGVPAGISKAARRDINARVVALVQDGQTDLDLMRQYSGNGGCGDSLNEFYTDTDVASAMWTVAARLAGPGGTALEPSCATGVFMHTAPAAYRVTGVEMDPISQACALALHGDRHEILAPQSLERFANSDGGRQFKVVIGNPPYGPRGLLAKDDKRNIKSAEAYFIDTALDKCQPGGIVSLVVPAGIMDSKNGRAFRERMLRKSEFLGAQRMPNSAFEASHTDVTADVIWLRKRGDDVAGALMTVDKDVLKKLGVWDDEFLAGKYFEGRGQANLFGKVGTAMRAFGEIYTVNGSMAGVPEQIAQFEPHPVGKTPDVAAIVEALGSDAAAVKRAMGGAMVRAYADGKAGDTKTVDGVTYVLQGKPLRWHRVDDMMEHEAVTDAAPLAEMIGRAMEGKPVDREALQAGVEAYVARHGVPVKNDRLVQAADQDRALHRLIGAVDRDGRLSDVVTGRQAKRIEGTVETAASTLAAERDTGTFTLEELAARSGRAEDGLEDVMHASSGYAYAGGGRWTTMDQYLTGDLWSKLDAVRAGLAQPDLDAVTREKYELQARRLDEAIAPKSLEDVEVMLNSAFLPTSVLEAWIDSKTEELRRRSPDSKWYQEIEPAKVTFDSGVYAISGGPGYSMLEKYLNRTGVRKDDMPAVDRMNAEFKAWLLTSPLRDSIEDLYNRKFRGYAARQWSQSPIDIPGLTTAMRPNDYHWDSLRWALHQGKGIIADDVGLGKTVRGLMLARLAKMNGKAQKPTFVVPKSVLANWVAETELWFPGSRVLVIGESYSRDKAGNLKSKPDTADERNRKYHDLTQNDYDFVFISQPAFNELDVDPVTKGQYLGEDFWAQRGEKLGNAGDKKVRRVREQFDQAAGDRDFGKRTGAIYFNQLPIDMLIVDEGHAYKNLYAAKARFGESPKFLGGQGQSNRAFDMGFKAKWLRDKNEGKGIYTLTATPTKNSPLEVYSMLSFIAPEEFVRIGIRNSEEFLDRYCEFKNETILGLNGAVEDGLVTAGFKNLDELRGIMSKYIMRRTAKDVGLKLPVPTDDMQLVDMSPRQAEVYGELRAQLAEVGGKDAEGDAHVFSIMDKMAKAALDLELLDPVKYAGEKSPKYAAVAKAAAARSKEGGQVIFCEAVDAHEKIAKALVEAGVPRDRIGIMNAAAASSSAARQNLSDKFNSGALDVIIGNKVMEEGVNLQKRTADLHHLDIPWDPATLQQRNGRGLRQGNKRDSIRIVPWLTRATFDGYRYQSMGAKRDWQDLLWSGGDRVENLGRPTLSREDMMVAMSVDPEATREKLANDKEAFKERRDAEGRVEASKQFVRFQSLSRSLRDLKNQDTASARRLRTQIERAKTGLANNPHFKAKGALDSNEDVLIHPGSGDIVRRDMGMEISEADGTAVKWVVTGVDPEAATVSMRMYGDTTGHKGVMVPLMKLAHGVKPFAFDKAAEATEVGAKMAAAANEKVSSIKDYSDLVGMPSAVLEANRDVIQSQLKAGAKTYGVKFPQYGGVPMVNKETGQIESMESYDHSKKHDTHDYLLPTDEAKEQAIQAWMAARRGARITTEFKSVGRGRGSRSGASYYAAARNYPGASYNNKIRNPHDGLLSLLSGGSGYGQDSAMRREARKRLQAEQMAAIRRAPSASDALKELFPLAKVSSTKGSDTMGGTSGENTATYPKDALMMAWARARRLGQLNEKVDVRNHASYALAGGHGQTMHAALIRMARASGHRDVADAFAVAGEQRGLSQDDKGTLQALTTDYDQSREALGVIEAIAGRNKWADSSIRNLKTVHGVELGGPFAYESGGYYSGGRNDRTLRQILDERIKASDLRATQKEAA